MTRVWFKLGTLAPNSVDVPEQAIINDLKRKIKETWNQCLEGIDAGQLQVFGHAMAVLSEHEREDKAVPLTTTASEPLHVTVTNLVSDLPRTKRLRLCLTPGLLVLPGSVTIPVCRNPEFVSGEEWEGVDLEIRRHFECSDEDEADQCDGFKRVPPMAVVRFSRGGKTRALYEIATICKEKVKVESVIYVSFNDSTSLSEWEQEDPLQALCLRIAFAALHQSDTCSGTRAQQFEEFRSRNILVEPTMILRWLGNSSAVLLVDELNNLRELTKRKSKEASAFGRFLKDNFLGTENRYFVFSSHLLDTFEFFSLHVDPSGGSIRPVVLQELPMANDLSTVRQKLMPHLKGPREAIYYGLAPAMIFEKANERPIEGKRAMAVNDFLNTASGDLTQEFKNILASIITGNLTLVPAPLHILLDTSKEKKIRWIPYHLQFVMEMMYQCAFPDSPKYRQLSFAVKTLCNDFYTAKEHSGDGWESLFVLFLLVRCIVAEPHKRDGDATSSLQPVAGESLLPNHWFAGTEFPHVTYNSSYNNPNRLFSACDKWNDLSEGLQLEATPQLSIFYPSHASFQVYDVIVVYSKDKKVLETYGYQCKEGKVNSKHDPDPDITRSFVLKGDSPQEGKLHRKWLTPSTTDMDVFFGESGRHWTPREWRRLSNTIERKNVAAASDD
jgi:hypothetical protein